MRADKTNIFDSAVVAGETDVEHVRSLSPAERGELLIAVCRDAAILEQSRQQSGLPPSIPTPWPASTWEFQRKWTAVPDPSAIGLTRGRG